MEKERLEKLNLKKDKKIADMKLVIDKMQIDN